MDRVVSITPISLDLTARANFDLAPTRFSLAWAAGLDMPDLPPLFCKSYPQGFCLRTCCRESRLNPAGGVAENEVFMTPN